MSETFEYDVLLSHNYADKLRVDSRRKGCDRQG